MVALNIAAALQSNMLNGVTGVAFALVPHSSIIRT